MWYDVVTAIKIQRVANLIMDRYKLDYVDTLEYLYNSATYKATEDDASDLHYRGYVKIFNMFTLEKDYGTWDI